MFEAEQFDTSEKFALGLPTIVTPENAGPESLGRFWTVPTHRGRFDAGKMTTRRAVRDEWGEVQCTTTVHAKATASRLRFS
jgi:hypothetical protein